MPSTVDGVVAILLGAAVLGSAFAMLSTRNIVHAAFWMLASMLATAGVYMLLSAEFVALVQIMVYAGAVAVLLLFAVMLTLRRREDAIRSRDFSFSALVLALLFGAVVYLGMKSAHLAPRATTPRIPSIQEFGAQLFSTWALPFEVASLLLTVALIGAVWWSGGGKSE
jgi:NADH-quinone oxidoreductase subunit J